MKKILMPDDVIIIDGEEITYNELKNALVDQHRYHKLSDFLQTTFNKVGVSNE